MRFPIYIFFLMSGFFYLTGNPFSDEALDTGQQGVQGKVAKLKYGRQVSTSSSDDKTADVQAKAADPKPVETAKREVLATPTSGTKMVDAKMQPSAVSKTSEPSSIAAIDKSSPASKIFAEDRAKRFKDPARKSLDWTVFGNQRKNASLALPLRTRSQDEIDAQGIAGEPARTSDFNPRKLAKKSKFQRKSLKAGRAARKARKAKRRLARLKRRSKGAYRIAGKDKKKSGKKKTVANKPPRKKFGFSLVGDETQLSN